MSGDVKIIAVAIGKDEDFVSALVQRLHENSHQSTAKVATILSGWARSGWLSHDGLTLSVLMPEDATAEEQVEARNWGNLSEQHW